MMQLVLELLKGAALVIAAIFASEAVSKLVTGKWLHEHVYEVWVDLREQIMDWNNAHQDFRAVKFIAKVVVRVDNLMNMIRRLHVIAMNERQQEARVTERVISIADYLKIKRELDHQEEMVLWDRAA